MARADDTKACDNWMDDNGSLSHWRCKQALHTPFSLQLGFNSACKWKIGCLEFKQVWSGKERRRGEEARTCSCVCKMLNTQRWSNWDKPNVYTKGISSASILSRTRVQLAWGRGWNESTADQRPVLFCLSARESKQGKAQLWCRVRRGFC